MKKEESVLSWHSHIRKLEVKKMKTRILLSGFIFFALVSCGVQNISTAMKTKLPSVEIRLNYEKK